MTEAIRMGEDPEEGLRRLLHSLLVNHRVDGVFTLTRVEEGKVAYTLVTDPERLGRSMPLYPLMPTNMGQVLDRFTKNGATSRPLAVVARPCEIRGFVEMVKRRLGRMDNLFFISFTCGGVFPTGLSGKGLVEKRIPSYYEALKKGEVHPDLRPTCRSCVEFVPYTADLTLRVADGPNGFVLLVNGDRGQALINGLPNLELGQDGLDQERIDRLRSVRSENRALIFAKETGNPGLSGLVSVFGKCIGCHACSKACPICHCNLCTFESTLFEKAQNDYAQALFNKKGMRLPPDTMFFHLGRMVHMATSCVACGSCQDVCPVDIPVSIVFKKVGESLQRTFDYVPGKDVSQPLPVSAFEVEEFMDIEGKERQLK